jgi:hypothetical protein
MNTNLPILFHDGCGLCLDIAQTLLGSMPGLTVVDLGLNPGMKDQAALRGVSSLPCLAIGDKLLPIAPHSALSDIGAAHH